MVEENLGAVFISSLSVSCAWDDAVRDESSSFWFSIGLGSFSFGLCIGLDTQSLWLYFGLGT